MTSKVILHIGHGKTGTSAIQSFLATNADRLERVGVRYPSHDSFEAAKKGGISSGNCSSDATQAFQKIKQELKNTDGRTLLFSSEFLFNQREVVCSLIEGLKGNVEFEILMFVRNPLEMINSVYHQSVKRSGEVRSFEEVAIGERHLLEAVDWHQALGALGVRVKTFNYSKRKTTVVPTFLEALGCEAVLEDSAATASQNRTVNRSLSFTELKLVRMANREFGALFGMKLSDRLVETSPDVKSYKLPMSVDLISNCRTRFAPAIEYFNARLPASDQLESIDPVPTTEATISEDKDEDFKSIVVAFKTLQDELDKTTRTSNLGRRLDYLDYKIHRMLGNCSVFGPQFQERFKGAADRRYHVDFDKKT